MDEKMYYISGTTKWKTSVSLTEEQIVDLERMILEQEEYIRDENPHSYYDEDGEEIGGTMFDLVERIGGDSFGLSEKEIYKSKVDSIKRISGNEWMEDE